MPESSSEKLSSINSASVNFFFTLFFYFSWFFFFTLTLNFFFTWLPLQVSCRGGPRLLWGTEICYLVFEEWGRKEKKKIKFPSAPPWTVINPWPKPRHSCAYGKAKQNKTKRLAHAISHQPALRCEAHSYSETKTSTSIWSFVDTSLLAISNNLISFATMTAQRLIFFVPIHFWQRMLYCQG